MSLEDKPQPQKTLLSVAKAWLGRNHKETELERKMNAPSMSTDATLNWLKEKGLTHIQPMQQSETVVVEPGTVVLAVIEEIWRQDSKKFGRYKPFERPSIALFPNAIRIRGGTPMPEPSRELSVCYIDNIDRVDYYAIDPATEKAFPSGSKPHEFDKDGKRKERDYNVPAKFLFLIRDPAVLEKLLKQEIV